MRVAYSLMLAITIAFAVPALADDQQGRPAHDVKYDLAMRLLEDNGAAKSMAQNIKDGVEQGITAQKKEHPEISDAFWAEFAKEAGDYFASHSDELTRIIAGVYAAHFTESELREAIAYFETGMGKKLSDPALQAEAEKRGGEWGEKLGAQITAQVMAKLKQPSAP